ncbi:hypothetical protein RB531_3608 [Salmonella enterica subsp. enterica serovar Typhimurium]
MADTRPAFWGINAMFGPLTLDLFADDDNAKCPVWYTADDNALVQDWAEMLESIGGAAFGNPPYSRSQYHEKQAITGMTHIMDHTMEMREKGGRYVFLVKAATSETWWPEDADHIMFIRGRIGFDLPVWFVPADDKQKTTGAFLLAPLQSSISHGAASVSATSAVPNWRKRGRRSCHWSNLPRVRFSHQPLRRQSKKNPL